MHGKMILSTGALSYLASYSLEVVAERGRPEAVLVCLHQTPSCAESYRALIERLRSQAPWLYVIALDTSGFGESPPLIGERPASIEVLSAPLTEAASYIARLLTPAQVHLCGHHTGASLALEVARNLPEVVGSLALIGLPLLPPHAKKMYQEHTRLLHVRVGEEQRMTRAGLGEADELILALRESLQKKDPRASAQVVSRELKARLKAGERLIESYDAVWGYDHESTIAQLSAPILLIAPQHDPLSLYLDGQHALMRRYGVEPCIARTEGGGYALDSATDELADLLVNWLDPSAPHRSVDLHHTLDLRTSR